MEAPHRPGGSSWRSLSHCSRWAAWAPAPGASPRSFLRRWRWPTVAATVEDVRQLTVRASEGDPMGVPHVRYRYAGPDGREHEGEARLPSALPVEPGQPISVQVHPQDPGRSVIPPPPPPPPPPRAWSAPVVTAVLQVVVPVVGLAVWQATRGGGGGGGDQAVGSAAISLAGLAFAGAALHPLWSSRHWTTATATVLQLAHRAAPGGGPTLVADLELQDPHGPLRRVSVPCSGVPHLQVGDTVEVAVGPGPQDLRLPAPRPLPDLFGGAVGLIVAIIAGLGALSSIAQW
uniref:DUF3592 domain-containing protein n=1 Tax=Arsenicicoccus bolidensis TaxID=229480 RepID=UPI0028AD9B93|nr:DUF3592 domain-containing protein [Arsenicicoccus bolidensis]